MDKENQFIKYTLSSESISRLNSIRNRLEDSENGVKNKWSVIRCEEPENIAHDQPDESNTPGIDGSATEHNDNVQDLTIQATQFIFTQFQRTRSTYDPNCGTENISEYIYELLEPTNGKLDVDSIQNVTDSELAIFFDDLNKKLSYRGIYNLCHSICDIEMDLSIRYISFICKNVLLERVISIDEPSRLLNAAILELHAKFPDDVQNLIFIPALNSDIKEVSSILNMINSTDIRQKRKYLFDLSTEVKDLAPWHISVLQNLIVPNLEENTKEKLFQLLWRKSYDFSRDKNYGKLILNLLKTSAPTTKQEKQLFEEIAEVNNTIFKKPIENVLKTIKV